MNQLEAEESGRAEEIIAELRRRSRWARPFLILGLAIIFTSLIGSVIYLNHLLDVSRDLEEQTGRRDILDRARAERAERAVESLSDTLIRARQAFESGDRGRTAALLHAAITSTEQLADRVAATAPVPAPNSEVSPPSESAHLQQFRPIDIETPPDGMAIPHFNIRPPSQPRTQIVYLQFAGLIRRETIVGLNRSLREAGWRAQGGDRGGERTPVAAGLNEVRCGTDEDCAAAAELAAAVSGTGVGGGPLRVTRNSRIVPGTLEIWVSN